jgi:hypothetical protein
MYNDVYLFSFSLAVIKIFVSIFIIVSHSSSISFLVRYLAPNNNLIQYLVSLASFTLLNKIIIIIYFINRYTFH